MDEISNYSLMYEPMLPTLSQVYYKPTSVNEILSNYNIGEYVIAPAGSYYKDKIELDYLRILEDTKCIITDIKYEGYENLILETPDGKVINIPSKNVKPFILEFEIPDVIKEKIDYINKFILNDDDKRTC